MTLQSLPYYTIIVVIASYLARQMYEAVMGSLLVRDDERGHPEPSTVPLPKVEFWQKVNECFRGQTNSR